VKYEPIPKEGTALDSAIAVLRENVANPEDPLNKRLGEHIIEVLVRVKTDYEAGAITAEKAVEHLATLYWAHQDQIQGTDAAHIIRCVTDDFGHFAAGLDLDTCIAIDNKAYEEVDKRERTVANWALYNAMQRNKPSGHTLPF
jgi:hypothetical protein